MRQGIGLWYEMWLMIRTSAKQGSVPHKVGCGIIQGAALEGRLLGITALLWLPSIAVTLLGAVRCVRMLSLLRSFAVNVSQRNCIGLKIPSRAHFPSSHIWVAERLGPFRSRRCVSPCSQEWNSTAEIIKTLKCLAVLFQSSVWEDELAPSWRKHTRWPFYSCSVIYRFLHSTCNTPLFYEVL